MDFKMRSFFAGIVFLTAACGGVDQMEAMVDPGKAEFNNHLSYMIGGRTVYVSVQETEKVEMAPVTCDTSEYSQAGGWASYAQSVCENLAKLHTPSLVLTLDTPNGPELIIHGDGSVEESGAGWQEFGASIAQNYQREFEAGKMLHLSWDYDNFEDYFCNEGVLVSSSMMTVGCVGTVTNLSMLYFGAGVASKVVQQALKMKLVNNLLYCMAGTVQYGIQIGVISDFCEEDNIFKSHLLK